MKKLKKLDENIIEMQENIFAMFFVHVSCTSTYLVAASISGDLRPAICVACA